MQTTTTSNLEESKENPDGERIGQTASSKVGFWGKAPVAQPAALTAQLPTITIADEAGTADYALQAITTTSAAGFATIQEAISFCYVVQNLQVRLAELEARVESCGLVAAN